MSVARSTTPLHVAVPAQLRVLSARGRSDLRRPDWLLNVGFAARKYISLTCKCQGNVRWFVENSQRKRTEQSNKSHKDTLYRAPDARVREFLSTSLRPLALVVRDGRQGHGVSAVSVLQPNSLNLIGIDVAAKRTD